MLCLWAKASAATQTNVVGLPGSGQFGNTVIALPNGNIVITDPLYDASDALTDVGAVYLYNGATKEMISVVTGSTVNDQVGSSIKLLGNGDFMIVSPNWDTSEAVNAGAITFCSQIAGCAGTVSAANSFIGSAANDQVGTVTALANGNYAVAVPNWDNNGISNVGAVTLCRAADGGCRGVVTVSNSITGSAENDRIGLSGVTALRNGNYVISSAGWTNNGATRAGAVTWCDGAVFFQFT